MGESVVTPRTIRVAGVVCTAVYASFILWVYATGPRTLAQVTGGMASAVGAYRVDAASFEEGLRFFRADQFPEARAAFSRADPAEQDARTQFYVAYTYYREGWGRLYNDDDLFRRGLDAVNRAVAAAGGGRIVVDDPGIGMRTADELKAELERGLAHSAADFNPLKVFRSRK
jgi:hypothetical protein